MGSIGGRVGLKQTSLNEDLKLTKSVSAQLLSSTMMLSQVEAGCQGLDEAQLRRLKAQVAHPIPASFC